MICRCLKIWRDILINHPIQNMKLIQNLLLATAILTLASCATKKADSSCSSCSSCDKDKKAATTGAFKKAAAATPQGQAASAGMKAAEKAKAQ